MQRQNAKATADPRLHADDIVADGLTIGRECKAVLDEYQAMLDLARDGEYAEAMQAVREIVVNSAEVAGQAKTIAAQHAAVRDVAGASGPVLLALAVLSWLR